MAFTAAPIDVVGVVLTERMQHAGQVPGMPGRAAIAEARLRPQPLPGVTQAGETAIPLHAARRQAPHQTLDLGEGTGLPAEAGLSAE